MHLRTARGVAVLAVGFGLVLATPAIGDAQGDAVAVDAEPPETSPEASDTGFCSHVPWIVGDVCSAVGDVVGGGIRTIVGGGASAVLGAIVGWVVDGAGWMLGGVAGFIDGSTRPRLSAGWFEASYRDMAVVAALGLLPFLLLAVIQALLRQDVGMMVRAAFAHVPLAAVGTAVAITVVDLLVSLTDELAAWIGRGMGADLSSFATGVGKGLALVAVPTSATAGAAVAGFAALIGGAVVAFASFVIWLELLLREAAIYVAVLFFPLAFMSMVWPATAHWLRRLVQGLVAIVLSKLVIVAVLALASNALDADVADDGFAVVVSGSALLTLAAFAPYVVLRLIPVFESSLSGQLEGTFRRPTAAVGTPVTRNQVVGILKQRAGGDPQGVAGGASAAAGPGRAATAGAAGGGIAVAAAAAATKGTIASARTRAEQVAETAGGAGRSSPAARRDTPRASDSHVGDDQPGGGSR